MIIKQNLIKKMDTLSTQLTPEELQEIHKMCEKHNITNIRYSPPDKNKIYETYEYWTFEQDNGYGPFKILRHHEGDVLHIWIPC